jgi:uncharacterized membrane protein
MTKKIIKYKAVSAACLGAIAIALGGFLWVYFRLRNTAGGGLLVLHFNDMNGITDVGNLWGIVSMGILGVAIAVVNFFIAMELEERDRFLGKVVAVASVFFAVLLFIAFAAILGIN